MFLEINIDFEYLTKTQIFLFYIQMAYTCSSFPYAFQWSESVDIFGIPALPLAEWVAPKVLYKDYFGTLSSQGKTSTTLYSKHMLVHRVLHPTSQSREETENQRYTEISL